MENMKFMTALKILSVICTFSASLISMKVLSGSDDMRHDRVIVNQSNLSESEKKLDSSEKQHTEIQGGGIKYSGVTHGTTYTIKTGSVIDGKANSSTYEFTAEKSEGYIRDFSSIEHKCYE